MNPFSFPKPPRPAKAAERSPAGAVASFFEILSVPVEDWMNLSRSDRETKAQQLITDARTSITEASAVRRIMDAYALAFVASRNALT